MLRRRQNSRAHSRGLRMATVQKASPKRLVGFLGKLEESHSKLGEKSGRKKQMHHCDHGAVHYWPARRKKTSKKGGGGGTNRSARNCHHPAAPVACHCRRRRWRAHSKGAREMHFRAALARGPGNLVGMRNKLVARAEQRCQIVYCRCTLECAL